MTTTDAPSHTVLGTCHHDCPDSCGWVATVEAGQVVQLRGNPDHPYSRGELCPKVNRFVDRVYADDRVLHPLIRTGAKGSGEFRRATWDEALGLVADQVAAVIAEHGGEAVLPWWDAGTQGTIQMSSLDRRLFHHLGAARSVGAVCGAAAREGYGSTYGSGFSANPTDLVDAELVILWATNTRLTNRHLWPFVEEARAKGAQVVVIDPIRTITAQSADWFLQPLPGTDTALIMAMLHVLVRDDLVDREYVASYTTGFDELAGYVADWTPERAASVTGLDATDIERLATRYGQAQPAFIRTLIGAEHHEHGARFFRALGCLPLVTGSWRHQGGGISRSVGAWASLAVDGSVFDPEPDGRVPTRSFNMAQLGRTLTDPEAGVHALFVWCGNPVVSLPNAGAIRRGLERDDLFTVVSEQFMTDTARFADVVFPATTQLEQLDVVESWGHLYLGWNEAAIEPVGESVSNTELWRRLAAAMHIDDPLFALDDESLIRLAVTGLDVDELRAAGFLRLPETDGKRLYAEGGFATLSGKAELWAGELDATASRVPRHVDASEGPHSSDRDHPLVLLTPKTHTRFLNSSYSHHHGAMENGPYVELDHADADARGVIEGDVVRIHNERGELTLAVRISDRLRPGVAAIPWGWWGDAANVNVLTNDTETDWGGGVAYSDTRVQVSAPSTG